MNLHPPTIQTDAGRVLAHLVAGNSLTVNECGTRLGVPSLGATIGTLIADHSILFNRRWDSAASDGGCYRYRIYEHPDNLAQALDVLLSMGYRHVPSVISDYLSDSDNNTAGVS